MKNGFASHLSPCYSIQFYLQRRKRKTVSIRITDEACVFVFAPYLVSLSKIGAFVDQKHDWIRKNQRKTKEKILLPVLSSADKQIHSKNVKSKANAFLIYYQGVKPKRVFVRYARTRWGSCSTLGNISLNGYLDFLPDELFQYVICHELTHLVHMNHSAVFWCDLEKLTTNPRKMKTLLDHYKIPSLESDE